MTADILEFRQPAPALPPLDAKLEAMREIFEIARDVLDRNWGKDVEADLMLFRMIRKLVDLGLSRKMEIEAANG